MGLLDFSLLQAAGLSIVLYANVSWLSDRVHPRLAPMISLVLVALASMATLWIVFLVPYAGHLMPYAFWLAVACSVFFAIATPRNEDAARLAILWGISTVALLLWAFWPTGITGMLEIARIRWSHPLPPDNELPLAFAIDLVNGHIPSPFFGYWLSSDRPPLQTGFFLLFRIPLIDPRVSYQIAATAAQMLVIPATYAVLRAFNASSRAATVSAVIIFFAPITLVNGIFVWPKLLTAAFLMAAAAIHFSPLYKEVRGSRMAGAATGLLTAAGILSHGAAAFSIIGFVVAALICGRWGTWRYASMAVVAAVLLYSPWLAYQKFYDPPGDRLIKYQLAGQGDTFDPRPAWTVLKDVYGQLTFSEWTDRLRQKADNTTIAAMSAYNMVAPVENRRIDAFFRPIPSMGLLSLPAVAALLAGLFMAAIRPLVVASIAGYLAWIMIQFDPLSVVVHVGSYLMELAPLLMLCIMLQRWPALLGALAVAQAIFAFSMY